MSSHREWHSGCGVYSMCVGRGAPTTHARALAGRQQRRVGLVHKRDCAALLPAERGATGQRGANAQQSEDEHSKHPLLHRAVNLL